MDGMRLDAEIVDKFSDPIKRLRTQMQALGRETKEHGRTIGDGFAHADRAISKTAATVTNSLTPALGSIGITSLGVTAALAGIGAAVRNFTTNASSLGQLGRDTGIAAEKLRDIQSILGKVGVDAGTSASAIQQFGEAARQARSGVGPLMDFLRTQGKTTEGRAYFSGLADDIMKSKDAGEAFMKALKGLEHVQDPAGRRVYAEQVLRMGDAARLAEKHRGTIDEQLAKANKEAGPLTPQMVESAEAYDRAMAGLATTMKKIGTAISMELEGPLSRIAVSLKAFMDGERNGVQPAIVTAIRDAVAYLESIDWVAAFKKMSDGFGQIKSELGKAFEEVRNLLRQLGDGDASAAVGKVFGEVGKAATSTATAIRSVALALGAMNDAKNFDFGEAGKKLAEIDRIGNVGIGKHSNREATNKPTNLDEQLDAQMRGMSPDDVRQAQNLRGNGPRVAQIEERLGVLGKLLGNAGSFPSGPAGEVASKRADEMRREMTKLTDELRRLREGASDKKSGDATAQQSSYDGGGFGGARVQTAAYSGGGGGGGGAYGAMGSVGRGLSGLGGGGGGGGGGTGRGMDALGDPHVQQRYEAFLRNHGVGGSMRRVGRWQRGEDGGGVTDTGPRLRSHGAVPKGQDERAQRAMGRLIARGWTPEAAASAIGQAVEESGVRSDGPLGDTRKFGTGDAAAHGMFQWREGRFRALKKFAETREKPWTDFDTQVDFFDEERKKRSRDERNWHNETDISQGNRTGKRFEGYDGGLQPQRERHARRQLEIWKRGAQKLPESDVTLPELSVTQNGKADDPDFFPNGAPRVLKPNSMKNAPGLTMDQANRIRAARKSADAGALSMKEQEKKDIEGVGAGFSSIRRYSESAAMRRATKAGANGGNVFNADGKVEVHVAKPGPDTKVSTSASGNLFRDVKLNRGKTMAPASGGD